MKGIRLSADKRDVVGYHNYQVLLRDRKVPSVFCNGELLKDCVTVDTEVGIAIVHVRGEDGKLVIDRERDVVVTKEVTGLLTVELAERDAKGRGQ